MTNGSIPRWLEEANQLDFAVYVAIAETATPALDGALSRLSRAADYSRLSLGTAAVLALFAEFAEKLVPQVEVSILQPGASLALARAEAT